MARPGQHCGNKVCILRIQCITRDPALSRESEMALKYATAVEAVESIRGELEALRAASTSANWAAVKVERAAAAAKVHELDLRTSTIAGELSGLQSVRLPAF